MLLTISASKGPLAAAIVKFTVLYRHLPICRLWTLGSDFEALPLSHAINSCQLLCVSFNDSIARDNDRLISFVPPYFHMVRFLTWCAASDLKKSCIFNCTRPVQFSECYTMFMCTSPVVLLSVRANTVRYLYHRVLRTFFTPSRSVGGSLISKPQGTCEA